MSISHSREPKEDEKKNSPTVNIVKCPAGFFATSGNADLVLLSSPPEKWDKEQEIDALLPGRRKYIYGIYQENLYMIDRYGDGYWKKIDITSENLSRLKETLGSEGSSLREKLKHPFKEEKESVCLTDKQGLSREDLEKITLATGTIIPGVNFTEVERENNSPEEDSREYKLHINIADRDYFKFRPQVVRIICDVLLEKDSPITHFKYVNIDSKMVDNLLLIENAKNLLTICDKLKKGYFSEAKRLYDQSAIKMHFSQTKNLFFSNVENEEKEKIRIALEKSANEAIAETERVIGGTQYTLYLEKDIHTCPLLQTRLFDFCQTVHSRLIELKIEPGLSPDSDLPLGQYISLRKYADLSRGQAYQSGISSETTVLKEQAKESLYRVLSELPIQYQTISQLQELYKKYEDNLLKTINKGSKKILLKDNNLAASMQMIKEIEMKKTSPNNKLIESIDQYQHIAHLLPLLAWHSDSSMTVPERLNKFYEIFAKLRDEVNQYDIRYKKRSFLGSSPPTLVESTDLIVRKLQLSTMKARTEKKTGLNID